MVTSVPEPRSRPDRGVTTPVAGRCRGPGPGTAATKSSFATELAGAATQTLHSS